MLKITPLSASIFGYDGDATEENEGRTYTHNGNTLPLAGAQYSDTTIAHTVRMLMRDDWSHETVVVLARDRILCLIAEKAALKKQLEDLRDATAKTEMAELYVPGVWRCAKCKFRLITTTMSAASGAMTPNQEPCKCPNCNTPMWRVSWKDEAKEAYKLLKEKFP